MFLTLKRPRIVESKDFRRRNFVLVPYEAIAHAMGVLDSRGYPLAKDILAKVYDLHVSMGCKDPESVGFKEAYAEYNKEKDTPLGPACRLSDTISECCYYLRALYMLN